jgi:hypothetical protein
MSVSVGHRNSEDFPVDPGPGKRKSHPLEEVDIFDLSAEGWPRVR